MVEFDSLRTAARDIKSTHQAGKLRCRFER